MPRKPQLTGLSGFSRYEYELGRYGSIPADRWPDIIIETTLVDATQPKQQEPNLQNRKHVAQLLEKFISLQDDSGLLKYLRRFGLPNVRIEGVNAEKLSGKWGPKEPEVHRIYEMYFIRRASLLRWLFALLSAVRRTRNTHEDISQMGDEQLRAWIIIERLYDPPPALFTLDDEPPPVPKKVVELRVKPHSDTTVFKDWDLAKEILGNEPPFRVPATTWSEVRRQRKLREDCVRNYLSFQINKLMESVSPAVTKDGRPYVTVHTHFQAMCLFLFNEFTGASGVGICRNPACPDKFYVVKVTGKRKPRSDREYCYRLSCQRSGYDQLGSVRPAKRSK